ncbi:MAG: hypothetical protein ABEJ28_05600 [Salinigranum sp.]
MTGGECRTGELGQSIGAFEGAITLADLFTDEWMTAHTDAGNIDAFIRGAEFGVETAADFYALPEREWDHYVADHSEYAGWSEMLADALETYLGRRDEDGHRSEEDGHRSEEDGHRSEEGTSRPDEGTVPERG